MKLYSWNVNGIRAIWKKGDFQKFITEHDPDILCLQETKAAQDQSPIDLVQYEEYWCSAERKGYSGTAIFCKTPPLSIINGFSPEITKKYDLNDSFGDTSKEGRVLSLEFEDFYVVTSYTPNSKGGLERLALRHKAWDPAFREHCLSLEAKKPVLICGDLNVAHKEIDLARPTQNVGKHGFTVEEREGLSALLDAGYIDTFRTLYPDTPDAYTWWTAWGGARDRNVGWRIDYWLASKSLASRIVDANIHPDVYGSDHCPVSLELSL